MKIIFLWVMILSLAGCQSLGPHSRAARGGAKESMREALRPVAEALSGKKLSEDQLRDLAREIRTDKEARSAVEHITEALRGADKRVKYCPLTGRRYAPKIIKCPEHGVDLKEVGR